MTMDWTALVSNGISVALCLVVIGYLYRRSETVAEKHATEIKAMNEVRAQELKDSAKREGDLRDRDRTDANKALSDVAAGLADLKSGLSRNTDAVNQSNTIRSAEQETTKKLLEFASGKRTASSSNTPAVGSGS